MSKRNHRRYNRDMRNNNTSNEENNKNNNYENERNKADDSEKNLYDTGSLKIENFANSVFNEEVLEKDTIDEHKKVDNSFKEESVVEITSQKSDEEKALYVSERPVETTMTNEINRKKYDDLVRSNEKNNSPYVGYYGRLIINIIAFIILLFSAILFGLSSVNYNSEKAITYRENSEVDYQVCLKNNEFYKKKCLGQETEVYVASLIDYIPISFVYDFEIEDNINAEFTYNIVGVLSIANDNGAQTFLEKEYTLVEEKTANITNDNKLHIEEKVNIDYDQYNDLANSFKTSYGLNTVSNLTVYLKINKTNKDKNFTFKAGKDFSMIIPLSQRAVDISLVYDSINESNEVISSGNITLSNITNVGIAVLLALIALYFLFRIICLVVLTLPKKNAYDKYVEKILNEYDRLIVETSTAPDLTEVNIIKIKKFSELLDVRDNLKLPIMYYVIVPHQKCYFYIKHGDNAYVNTVKAVDIENLPKNAILENLVGNKK